MKKLTILAAALLCAAALNAQELVVKDFRLDAKDRTACARATARKDAAGKKCAVIKLNDGQTALYGDAVAQPSLLYVSAKETSVKIDGGEAGAVEYAFPFALKAGRTYVMDLELVPAEPEPEPEPIAVPQQQFVLFTVSPEQAIIELGDETVTARGGEAQKLLNVGHYTYKVSAKGFYPAEGEFDLADSAKVEVAVALREANGWLNVLDKDEIVTGASVYIDDEFAGKAPVLVGQLLNGTHKLMISQEEYNNYITTINIVDNDTLVVSPNLDPKFSVVTLKTSPNAEIWANGVWKGTGSWTGKMIAGVYDLESREIGYTSAVITEEIAVCPEELVIEIPAPAPIYGNVLIMSYPAKADVFVDGELVGETPVYLPKVQYGQHNILILKDGFKPYKEVVDMSESMRIEVAAELQKKCPKCLAKEAAEAACGEHAAEDCCAPAEAPIEDCCEVAEEKPAEDCCEAAEEKPAEDCCEEPATEPAVEPAEAPAEAPAEEPAVEPEAPAETPAEPAPAEEPAEA